MFKKLTFPLNSRSHYQREEHNDWEWEYWKCTHDPLPCRAGSNQTFETCVFLYSWKIFKKGSFNQESTCTNPATLQSSLSSAELDGEIDELGDFKSNESEETCFAWELSVDAPKRLEKNL